MKYFEDEIGRVRKNIILMAVPAVIAELVCSAVITKYYSDRVGFICSSCGQTFKPGLKEAISASHTPTARKLKCPNCGSTAFCKETVSGK